jgi:gamma-glutamylcyclotransferase (GGCT)/AIG2-like uncharacterized protein YtfP
MYYFAYGANLNKRGMSRRCPAAQPVGIATLKDYKLCFKRFADIIPTPGAQVMGVVWQITPSCMRALDSYEGADYQQITITVTQASQDIPAMAYAMKIHTALAPPSMDYYRDLTVGYRDWELDEALLRRARYDTLKVGVTTPPAEQNAPAPPLVKRRSALWDPAEHTSGSLDILSQGRGRFGIKRRTTE